jgi:hypothetical protein
MVDMDVRFDEIGRRLLEVEHLTDRLSETVIRLQTIADLHDNSSAKWWALMAGMATSVAGSLVALVVTLAH